MRHLIFFFFMIVCTTMNAQKDVTTFLGIPVDGTKTEMRRKLIEKGFVSKDLNNDDVLEGEYNGTDVVLFIKTNNKRVYRISLIDKYGKSEQEIKDRYNKLVEQFRNNKRYHSARLWNMPLTDDDDVKDHPQAVYYQNLDPTLTDFAAREDKTHKLLKEKYSEEELAEPSYEIQMYRKDIQYQLELDELFMKCVWFQIFENDGKFNIGMFYDNKYNQSNGEDL